MKGAGALVLDFGSGPTPALTNWLKELNYQVEMYDKYFVPGESWKAKKFDGIIASEVLEHLREPRIEIENISYALAVGGVLIISTGLTDEIKDFDSWYYPKDPTHLVFYSTKTFEWIGKRFGLKLLSVSKKRIIVLQK